MTEFVFKLPDLGEGTVEAEIIEWHVKPDDVVNEGDIIVDVMTDKANIEVPAPTSGRVLRTSGVPGDMVAVGAELIAFETEPNAYKNSPTPSETYNQEAPASTERNDASSSRDTPSTNADDSPAAEDTPSTLPAAPTVPGQPVASVAKGASVLASPALRRRASELGIDLYLISGTGPRGRILRRDLEQAELQQQSPSPSSQTAIQTRDDAIEEIKVIGLRRLIAERMQAAKREIPHFSYVEEVDITELEALRVQLNRRNPTTKLTYLPFVALALCKVLPQFPQCNQRFDAERGVLQRYRQIHLGIAAQTTDGLKVPVVRNAHALDLFSLSAQIQEVTSGAKSGSLAAKDLSGSTITITSLGKLGGIVSTPVINAPEMGIVGVNKAAKRPMIVDGEVVPRWMMNLSSSFDHRFVDGFDAASMIQELRTLLESPALMFVDEPTA